MDMLDAADIRECILPPAFVSKDIAKDTYGNKLYDYEDWLREFVNSSDAFLQKTAGEQFRAPAREDHGEADAITSRYEIDFKLILGQSMQCALRETSFQLLTQPGGGVFFVRSKEEGERKAVRLFAALRGRDVSSLRSLWGVDRKALTKDLDCDIASFLKTLDKDKHLLLLLPLLLYADGGMGVSPSVASEMVYSDFEPAIRLRREFHPQRETYLAFFVPHRIEFIKSTDTGWVGFDSVPTNASKTFSEVRRLYSPLDYRRIDLLS